MSKGEKGLLISILNMVPEPVEGWRRVAKDLSYDLSFKIIRDNFSGSCRLSQKAVMTIVSSAT